MEGRQGCRTGTDAIDARVELTDAAVQIGHVTGKIGDGICIAVDLGIDRFQLAYVDGIRIGNPVGNIGNTLIIGMNSGIVNIRFAADRQLTVNRKVAIGRNVPINNSSPINKGIARRGITTADIGISASRIATIPIAGIGKLVFL